MQYDFLGGRAYGIHAAHPFHLILGLECLGDALSLCHILHEFGKHLTSVAVGFFQVGAQLAAEEHTRVERLLAFQQVILSAGPLAEQHWAADSRPHGDRSISRS